MITSRDCLHLFSMPAAKYSSHLIALFIITVCGGACRLSADVTIHPPIDSSSVRECQDSTSVVLEDLSDSDISRIRFNDSLTALSVRGGPGRNCVLSPQGLSLLLKAVPADIAAVSILGYRSDDTPLWEGLVRLKHLRRLELGFSAGHVVNTDAIVKYFAGAGSLRSLVLRGSSRVVESAMNAIAEPSKLEELRVVGLPLLPQNFVDALNGMDVLHSLTIDSVLRCEVPIKDYPPLSRSVEVFEVRSCQWLAQEHLEALGLSAVSLKKLTINNCGAITDRYITDLLCTKGLEDVDIGEYTVKWSRKLADTYFLRFASAGIIEPQVIESVLANDSILVLELSGMAVINASSLQTLQRASLSRVEFILHGLTGGNVGALLDLLKLPSLRRLSVTESAVSAQVMVAVTACATLEVLELRNTSFVGALDGELPPLAELKRLALTGTNLPDRVVRSILSSSTKLTNVQLDLDGGVSVQTVATILTLPEIVSVAVGGFNIGVTSNDTMLLFEALNKCKTLCYLNITGGRNVSAAICEAIAALPNLRTLVLRNSDVTDVGVGNLVSAKALVDLDLSGSKTTGNCVESLRRMQNLRRLDVVATQWATKDLLASLMKSMGSQLEVVGM